MHKAINGNLVKQKGPRLERGKKGCDAGAKVVNRMSRKIDILSKGRMHEVTN